MSETHGIYLKRRYVVILLFMCELPGGSKNGLYKKDTGCKSEET
jgi:hypothetical protein